MSEREPRRPERPTVPAVLWGLVACLIAERTVIREGQSSSPEGLRHVALLLVAVAAVMAVGATGFIVLRQYRHRGYHDQDQALALRLHDTGAEKSDSHGQESIDCGSMVSSIAAITACALAGALVACLACARQLECQELLLRVPVSRLQLVVATDASISNYGYRCRAHVRYKGATCGDVWISSKEAFERGQVISGVGRYAPLGSDEYGASSWIQGVVGTVHVVRVARVTKRQGLTQLPLRMRMAALGQIGPGTSDTRALLAGILCGWRSAIAERGIDEVFASCGLAHVVAVSGAHLALISAIVSELLTYIHLPRVRRLIVLALVTGFFVLMCGAPSSAIRAWLMSLIGFGAQMTGRRSYSLSSVSVVALLMALADPHLSGQLGFLLSVCSVVGLCLFARYASYVLAVLAGTPKLPRWVRGAARKRFYTLRDAVISILAATLVCQTVTLPLSADAFGCLSLIAPISNLVVSPFLGILLACGLGACCLAPVAPLSQLALGMYDAVARVLLHLLHILARSPYAVIPVLVSGNVLWVAVLLGAVALLAWWPRVARRRMLQIVGMVGLLAFVLLVRWRYLAPARMVVLDVGQGDAILVQDGSSAILVDAGPEDAVVEALAREHVLHLDTVLLTHLHDDHYGGVLHMAGSTPCERVVVGEGVTASMSDELHEASVGMTGSEPLELSYGDQMRVGHFILTMIWPHEATPGTENKHSIELLLTYTHGNTHMTALLTGDAERDETDACVHAGDVGAIDVLKVGHHGSEVSLTPELSRVLCPALAIASAGEGNEYGHPRPECVQMLTDVGAQFLCTKDHGDIEVRPTSRGLKVRSAR